MKAVRGFHAQPYQLCPAELQGPPCSAYAAGVVVKVKAPGTSRAFGKGQPHSNSVPILFVQSFLERPVVLNFSL